MSKNLIEHWVRQAQGGNLEAFNRLAENFRGLAMGEALRWLGDRQSAEDVTQDALLTAYKHLHQLRNPEKFGAWLRQIVKSQCNLVTRRKRLPIEPLHEKPHLSEDDLTPEHIIESRESRAIVREAIENLPEHERIVTEEFYLKGQKQADIAEKLDIPVTTVKKRLQYARKKLKGLIEPLTLLDPDLLPSWREIRRIFGWYPRLWRKIRDYEQHAAKFCHLLFFVNHTDFIAYRKPDDQSGNRHLDL